MLKNYLKIAFRNIFRNKTYSFISIAGLAVGMAACISIFVYVQYEYSFDSFNKKEGRIYRLNVEVKLNGKRTRLAPVLPTLGPYMKSAFPQIVRVTRLSALNLIFSSGNPTVKSHSEVLDANRFVFADSTFFDVFTYRMIEGNPQTALAAPFSVVLTEDVARKLFGNQNPLGRSIIYDSKFSFTVTGIVQNPPANSTIQFDYLASLNSLPDIEGQPQLLTTRGKFEYFTYLLLNRSSSASQIERLLPHALSGYWSPEMKAAIGTPVVQLEPLRDIRSVCSALRG